MLLNPHKYEDNNNHQRERPAFRPCHVHLTNVPVR
jgi:hypothetical protein